MMSHTTIIPLRRPDEADDPLTAVLRSGARRLLAQAIGAEAEAFLATMKGVPLSDGRERIMHAADRHGGQDDGRTRAPARPRRPARR